ncbi:MAG: hypothetical protein ACL7BU_11075 [Candidatus Phlomobacter fragariae]
MRYLRLDILTMDEVKIPHRGKRETREHQIKPLPVTNWRSVLDHLTLGWLVSHYILSFARKPQLVN